MDSVVESVRQQVDSSCEADECEEDGCVATLEGVRGNYILVSLDCPELRLLSVTRADYILATDANVVACVELKGGRMKRREDRAKAVEQLQASAEFVERMLLSDVASLVFRPVLVHEREFGAALSRSWARRKVVFRGKDYPIRRVRCGNSLEGGIR